MNHYFTNEHVKSNLQKIKVQVLDRSFSFYTDFGVFSKNGLDFGSRILLETLIPLNLSGDILDLGCGYGPIGIILSKFNDVSCDFVDVNLRAIHLAKMNMKENQVSGNVFESDGYSSVIKKYNSIITNPPIHAGKAVVYSFIFGAKDYLVDGGNLFFVINKDHGAKSLIGDLEKVAKITILEKRKGFFIIQCNFN